MQGNYSELLESMRLGVLRGERRHETILYGHVTAYNPQDNTVQVKVYPGTDDGGSTSGIGGVAAAAGGAAGAALGGLIGAGSAPTSQGATQGMLITEFMPLFTPWSGNKWGFQAGPVLDGLTQVAVHVLEEGDGAHYVYATFYHDKHVAPGAPSGELWMVHMQTKTYIKLQNDSSLRESGTVRTSLIGPRTQAISTLPTPLSGTPAINSALGNILTSPDFAALSPTLQAQVTTVVGGLQGALTANILSGNPLASYLNTAFGGQSIDTLLSGTPFQNTLSPPTGAAIGALAGLNIGLGTALSGEDQPDPKKVVRCVDINNLVMFINAFVDKFNAHVHSGVQTGPGNTAVPTTTNPHETPFTCALTLYAE